MKRKVNKEVKKMWLSRMFYGASHSFDFNINPYEEISEFLNSKVSALKWGENSKKAKELFSKKYHFLLDLYGIKLPIQYIMAELNEDNQLNDLVVEHWAEHSEFPAQW